MRRALATVALLTVLLAGCGGDSDEAEPSRETPTTAAGAATPGSVDTNFSGKDSERFCNLARGYGDKLGELGTTDPAKLKTVTQDAEAAIKEAVEVAPSEIKRDVQLVATASTAFFQQLAKVDYDITRLSSDAVSGLQKPEVQTATERLGAYTQNVCGITPPSSVP